MKKYMFVPLIWFGGFDKYLSEVENSYCMVEGGDFLTLNEY